MKKSLLALAALCALSGVASAQSSVTLYGKVDLSLGKQAFSKDKTEDNNSSRLGFKGTEDLGSGMSAIFQLETRFDPSNGTASATFWGGESWAGLATPYGTVKLGRQYTAAFAVQNALDPWKGDTVASPRNGFLIASAVTDPTKASSVDIGQTRVENAVVYELAVAGFKVGASIAEAPTSMTVNGNTVAGKMKRPVSLALSYAAGPLYVGYGYENPQGHDDTLSTLGATYDFGFIKPGLSLVSGKTNDYTTAGSQIFKVRSYVLTAEAPLASTKLSARGAYAQTSLDPQAAGETKKLKKASIGLTYSLSKRTMLYTDFAKLGGNTTTSLTGNAASKSAYDFGLQHKF